MPRFRVMVRCDGTQILLEGKPTEVGFFATRAVDADTPEEAVSEAVALVRRDVEPRITQDAAIEILVEDITLESWWWRRFRPPAGFTFFLTNRDADGQTGADGKQ